jgi:putative transposase
MFKGHCFPKEIILQAVYFKLRFGLSYRDIEELLSVRGIRVDHATVQRCVYKFAHLIEGTFKTKKKLVGNSWRMVETYFKVKDEWMFLYRAKVNNIDQSGANKEAIRTYNKRTLGKIRIRQCKYLNNRIEADGLYIYPA